MSPSCFIISTSHCIRLDAVDSPRSRLGQHAASLPIRRGSLPRHPLGRSGTQEYQEHTDSGQCHFSRSVGLKHYSVLHPVRNDISEIVRWILVFAQCVSAIPVISEESMRGLFFARAALEIRWNARFVGPLVTGTCSALKNMSRWQCREGRIACTCSGSPTRS